MKLNIWQWLGIILLLICLPIWAYRRFGSEPANREVPSDRPLPDAPAVDPTTNPSMPTPSMPTTVPASATTTSLG
jgi:hypothetical protein